MKKCFALLMMGILLIASAALAEDEPMTIQSMTGLGDIREKLDQSSRSVNSLKLWVEKTIATGKISREELEKAR